MVTIFTILGIRHLGSCYDQLVLNAGLVLLLAFTDLVFLLVFCVRTDE